MKPIKAYFEAGIKAGASDVHIVGGKKPTIRVHGQLQDLEDKPLPGKETAAAILGLMTAEQKKRFENELELDMSYETGGARFRVNVHKQLGQLGLAARLIPREIPAPDELRFEPTLRELPNLLDGLVLVVGPTGSGKSTTLASMIEEINKSRKAHVVTIEDPIEFLFADKESLIIQREVGADTLSFAAALKHVLRQDPNVILVGEMRDPETIATVLTAAETGHLVFSTLHTSSAAEAVERIVDVFEGAKQKQVLIQLSTVLRVVVAQQLIPGAKGKRVAAREVMVVTPAVANLIKENNIAQIKSAMQTGVKEGMIPMEMSLKNLYKDELITKEMMENRSGRQRKI